MKRSIRHWLKDEEGASAVEFALVFPIMFIMMLAIWDIGNGIIANQKAIAAAQMVADLVAREIVVDDTVLGEVYTAARVAMIPAPTENNFKVEVLSAAFNIDTGEPETRFHRVSDGSAPDGELIDSLIPLSIPGDGAVVVQVHYTYTPSFANFITGDIHMRERAYSRGRRTAIINPAT